MFFRKKIIAAVLSAAMLAASLTAFTGCADTSYAAVIDGTSIPAGVYIYQMFGAASDAVSKFTEEQPDIDTSAEGFDYFTQTVGGKPFADYVEEQTLTSCKKYVAVEKLFDSLGLSLTDEEKSEVNDSANSAWNDENQYAQYYYGVDTYGAYYEAKGISKNSYKLVLTNAQKEEKIFSAYYGEGGTEAVSADEIKNYIVDNYALVRYISVSLNDADGNLIEDAAKLAELEAQANGYAEEINNGAKFSEVLAKYNASVEAAAADTTAAETTAAETTAAEMTAVETTSAEEASATAAALEEAATEAAETASAETTVTETATAAETTAAADTVAASEAKESDNDRIINKEQTTPSEEFVAYVFEQENGKATVFKGDTYYYVVVRYDITQKSDDTDYIDGYKSTALHALKDDAFKTIVETAYSAYTVTTNANAIALYSAESMTN